MSINKWWLLLLIYIIFVAADEGSEGMDMDMGGDMKDIPSFNNPKWDAFHWMLSLVLLLIIPSIAAVLGFAEREIIAVNLHMVSTGYALVEALLFRFEDLTGHENKTSRGTAWFLFSLLGATTFFGLLLTGSKFLPARIRDNSVVSQYSSTFFRRTYKTLSVLVVMTGWVKVCLAVVALCGFCYATSENNHTGQCLAHGIMGTAFTFYGFLYLMVLVIPWFRNSTGKYSQEFYDSAIITLWGFVNTFTEHRPWEPWSHGDFQHTAMGIFWWCMGLVGLWLTRDGLRSIVPGLVIAFTGWSMSVHVQHLMISTQVHFFFGVSLMIAGFSRVIEISFLLNDKRSIPNKINSFQYLAPISLIEAGVLFMGANEEQLKFVRLLGAGHAAYIMALTSAVFLVVLWILMILDLYLRLVGASKYGYEAAFDDYSRLGDSHVELGENASHAGEFELDSLTLEEARV